MEAITTPKDGSRDGIAISGRADLAPDGSALVEMEQRFLGKLGIRMRGVFDKVSESQLFAFVESRVLTSTLPGARVRDVKVENKTNLDAPLVLRVKAEVPQLGRVQGNQVLVKPIFPLHLVQLASLPTRQVPLLLGTWTYVDVDFAVVCAAGLRMPATVPTGDYRHGELVVSVKDSVHGHELRLQRTIDLAAGRVQPGDDYASFQRFTRDADTALEAARSPSAAERAISRPASFFGRNALAHDVVRLVLFESASSMAMMRASAARRRAATCPSVIRDVVAGIAASRPLRVVPLLLTFLQISRGRRAPSPSPADSCRRRCRPGSQDASASWRLPPLAL